MTSKSAFKRIPSFAALTVAVIAALPSVATARPITEWTYSTDTNFTAATFNTGGGGTTTSSPDELSWGATGGDFQIDTGDANTNRSALTIGNGVTQNRTGGGPVVGSVNTTIGGVPSGILGQVGIGTSFTHWNNPISAGFNTLSGGTITDTLTLTPVAPTEYLGQPLVNAPTLTFQFKFLETPNGGTNGVCEDGQAVPGGGCEDLFGFNATTLNQAFTYADSGANNILGDGDDFMRTYFASIFILNTGGGAFPIQQLVAGECAALGLNNGCFGFRTNEASQTTAVFAFAVTTQPIVIPEPGSLALAGLALVGLAARMRRRRFD
jgi:hypothetical protein